MNYPSIRIEGAILSPDIIDRLDDMPGQRPADFGFESGTKVKDEIARAWADAQDYWRIFQRKLETLKPDASAATETRNNWIVPLLSLLKYDLEYQKQGAELNGKIYAISHRVTNRGQTPVHIVGYRDPAGLDRKPANATLRMSAHAMVQEYLNLTEQLYGVVTNGRVIRLLRDSSRLIKQSYLEFDLDRIFTDGLFADFAVMYRLLHATRLPVSAEAASESLIEKLHQDSLDSGARIREGLSRAVEEAILAFGNGFLAHPANTQLRERVATGQLAPDQYYASLLRLIYRLLFLMVIEERGLVFPPKATQSQRETYLRYYSVQRLRALSEKRYLADKRQSDLWLALLSTFRLFEADGPGEKLGLKPLAGDLFRPDAIGELEVSQLSNEALLNCLRSLGLYEHPQNKQLIRVNYAALNVEEFGSVYEGLLEYEPVIESSGSVPVFAFKQGDERAATGSHYTPDDLVQPLIKHSLDHLIAERLKEKDPAAALLDLRVADIACGSGHILLAAARRIATELAVVRTGEEQPSPAAYRAALRDAIRNCIYGVDYNPLAVELCKVALWLEAHNPGEPLNFLDHHIKCGNSIVGFVKREEVDNGVPDEAFAKLPGDDAEVGKMIRARNKRERTERNQGKLSFTPARENEIKGVLDRWGSLAAMPERTPAEIDDKKRAYEAFSGSGGVYMLKQLASIPIAQFYIPRTEENESKLITDAEFREIWSGNQSPQGQAPAAAFAVASRKRFFHWFIEFPEVVQRGGFDCVLGNPPFLGGKRISGTFGDAFLLWVKTCFAPDKGITDLAAYFFRRAYELLRFGGAFGLISTNTIAQGDTRFTGLEQIRNSGGHIVFAVKSMRWPGVSAAVEVALVAVYKGDWRGSYWLGGVRVSAISTFLDTDSSSSGPVALRENRERAFIGSIILGNGFLVEFSRAVQLIADDPGLVRVLKPYLTGADLNGNPLQAPSRFVIDFGDLSLDEASGFAPLFEQVEREVRPQREAVKREIYRENWWRFAERCPGLYRQIARLTRVLVVAQVSQTVAFVFVRRDQVFSAKTIVFAMDKWSDFAQLQSSMHNIWAWKYCTTMKSDLSYGPTAIFQPFPMVRGRDLDGLEAIGERYHEHRRTLMIRLWLGLTDVYNLFHSKALESDLKKHFAGRAKKDPQGHDIPEVHREAALKFNFDEALAGIIELRRLHVELDDAVLAAYGWHEAGPMGPAVNLAHDFYEVETLPENDRTRYTISPAARKELLARLLKENHTRAAAEAASAPVAASKPAGKSRGKKKSAADDGGLFA